MARVHARPRPLRSTADVSGPVAIITPRQVTITGCYAGQRIVNIASADHWRCCKLREALRSIASYLRQPLALGNGFIEAMRGGHRVRKDALPL